MRILSFDGAVAANVQVRVLAFLERDVPGFLRRADLFAGTSDGTLVGLYLANRLRDPSANEMDIIQGAIQFTNDMIPAMRANLLGLFFALCGIRPLLGEWPCTTVTRLERVLTNYFGNTTIGELDKKILAVSFDLTDGVPRIFTNFVTPGYMDRTLVDVGLSSGSLPLFMVVHGSPVDGHRFLDGATVANNPTMVAITQAAEYLHVQDHLSRALTDKLQNLLVLSLGGRQPKTPVDPGGIIRQLIARVANGPPPNLRWGYWQWLLNNGFNIVDLLFFGWFQGVSIEAARQAEMLLTPARCMRLVCELNEFRALTALEIMPAKRVEEMLDKLAAEVRESPEYAATVAWAKTKWMAVDAPPR
jgi:hypothetical protein